MSEGDLILYRTEDGAAQFHLRELGGNVWLSQKDMADLFETSVSNINKHIKGILDDNELDEATIEFYSIVRSEGEREVKRQVAHYNLRMIVAVAMRVRSPRGTQFRQWATSALEEYLVKGFVMNEERLKDPSGWDYFDELLERIRDIRASEKRFYQKVLDIYATASDYDKNSDQASQFFKTAQNKMVFATTGKTAAELIMIRADADKPNMGLTTWKGDRVRKGDVTVSKNYLSEEEVSELNRITTMYLDFAEDQAKRRKTMTMADWESKLDAFLEFNDREVLQGAGKRSHKQMINHVGEVYAAYDDNRREAERVEADRQHMEELHSIETKALSVKKGDA